MYALGYPIRPKHFQMRSVWIHTDLVAVYTSVSLRLHTSPAPRTQRAKKQRKNGDEKLVLEFYDEINLMTYFNL